MDGMQQISFQFDLPPPIALSIEPEPKNRQDSPEHPVTPVAASYASGEKSKARDIIAAIRTLKTIEQEQRPVTGEEKQTLARFAGFGPVALSIFPEPVSGRYKDASWQALGEELTSLLSPQEYDSAKRTTFNAFYTSPTVIAGIHEAIARLGIPNNATVLEPGCGTGNFMRMAPIGMRFIGVELDSISARIARALHPGQDIRIESFADTRLPEDRIDAVIGNVPFADLKLDYAGQKLSLHDYFFAKSVDALKPGGVLAMVTTHFTLDKQNAAIREYLGSKADFVGAIRLPSDAFKREGTAVVTDIIFLRKRAPGEPAHHADPEWLGIAPLSIEDVEITRPSARMLSPTAPDFPGSKVNALVENVLAIWKRTEATRGTQMIFCDMGVHPTPWGYSAYDEIISKLVDRGVPRAQIAAIGPLDGGQAGQLNF